MTKLRRSSSVLPGVIGGIIIVTGLASSGHSQPIPVLHPRGYVHVIEEKGEIAFEFYREAQAASGRFEKANARSLKINLDTGSRAGGNPVVWYVKHTSYGSGKLSDGVSKISYGEVPDGFVQLAPKGFAPPLLPNSTYFVFAHIGAAVGMTSFVYHGQK